QEMDRRSSNGPSPRCLPGSAPFHRSNGPRTSPLAEGNSNRVWPRKPGVTSNSHGTPRFIDTNILLRYFTGDDPRKAAACLALLQRIEDGQETAITSSLVVFETAFSLYSSYHLTRERIRDLLAPVLGLRGLRVPDRQTF